ncbi:MAG: fumarylacetoacetate hydrolase family protein [Deltaproteobacteria bacterium]|nr:fumarylacetoacetate hydrolase family protein [Deltaproteobacteria bacterium]
MKLATIYPTAGRSQSRDGQLVVVDEKARAAALVPENEYPTLRSAIEDWQLAAPRLAEIGAALLQGDWKETLDLDKATFMSPLPRAFGFLDGSAYLSHVRRVRKARGAEMPEELETIPLMYQGVSAPFLDPGSEITISDEAFGYDFEAELAVIVDDVPQGVKAADAEKHIKLILLLNDISLRNLIPAELARGFGFLQSKPCSSCAPFALSPDELGPSWKEGRAEIEVRVNLNGSQVGKLRASEMHFSFPQLIEHAARTRPLAAGTIIGSGTVSNEDKGRGIGCLVEKRLIEIIDSGAAKSNYLKVGDQITIEAFLGDKSLFGKIEQRCSL